jgi:hypothetical protein
MNAPFELPVRWEATTTSASLLIAEDQELVAEVLAATDAERAYIALAINNHEKLKTALINLLKVTELNMDDMEDSTREQARYSYALLAELGEGGHK